MSSSASDFSDVFVSYRRKDVEFTKQVVEALRQAGKEAWVDWEDIPPGSVGFSDDIKRGLEGADAFIAVLTYRGHDERFLRAALSSDGTRMVTGAADDKLILWDVNTGEVIRALEGHRDSIRAIEFTPDSQRVLTASDDGTANLWNVDNSESVAVLAGHRAITLGCGASGHRKLN